MWASLFAAIGEGFRTIASLWGKNPEPPPIATDPLDADAARAGTAAGAAANHAGHIAGRP